MKDYRKYLPKETPEANSSWRGNKTGLRFRADQFVASQRRDFQPFLEELMTTQQFDDFLTKRIYSSTEPDVIFFDKSIEAKRNKIILNRKKADLTYLNAANAHRDLQQYDSIPPNYTNILPGECSNNTLSYATGLVRLINCSNMPLTSIHFHQRVIFKTRGQWISSI